MKRITIFVIVFTSFVFTSFGQLIVGIKAGANLSGIIVTKTNGDLTNPYSSRMSFHAGSYIQEHFTQQLLWQIEVLFSNKGYKMEVDGHTENISLNYLNWPILLVYRPYSRIEFEFGPELGYMISGEDYLNGFDLGIDVGGRYNFNNKLNAGLRYSYGLPFKFKTNDTSYNGNGSTYQNNVFQIYLGFNLIHESGKK